MWNSMLELFKIIPLCLYNTKDNLNGLFHFMAEMSLANLMAKGYIKSSSIESGVILSYRMSITATTIHVLSHTQPIWNPEPNHTIHF